MDEDALQRLANADDRARPYWCITCQTRCESIKGHFNKGHDLVRVGPKPPLPPDAGLLPGERPAAQERRD